MGKLDHATFITGDATEELKKLEEESVQTCVISLCKLMFSLILISGDDTGVSIHNK